MMAAVTASIVVSFSGGAGESMLIAELDDIKNSEKTSFLISETCYFTVYKYPSTIQVSVPIPTSGMVTYSGIVTRAKTERLEFVNTQSITLSHPPVGAVTVIRWYGNEGQDFTVSGFTATISNDLPCICEVSYPTQGALWRLYPPNDIDLSVTPEWPIVILVIGNDA